jgi:2-polyprenyl-3-methyl-5-hydroxy-6-metoxy-1,4-benzoquinol methylase
MDLVAEFARRGPWITQFVIDGVPSGGDYQVNDQRVQLFLERFPNAHTILELGSLEGGHTFMLARQPGVERVLATEGRLANIDKAKFIGSLLGVSNVQFKHANLEQLQLQSLGYFDAIFCCGLLYHLPEPWKLISQAPLVAPHLFIGRSMPRRMKLRSRSMTCAGENTWRAVWTNPSLACRPSPFGLLFLPCLSY